jgi:glycosyltransferase involved in cell wall biosynthesis
MRDPKISVVTCCYNHVSFLERTITSVLDQKYPNLEYIIIDGGSTDGSKDIIQRYSTQLAYWVSEPDEGQTHALIKGFNRATGDISCWLCSDDLFEPWTLREVADFFERRPEARVAYGDATWIDVQDRVIRKKREHGFNRFIWMHDYNFIPQPSTFWRHDLYLQVGGLDPAFDWAMDADLWARFAEVTHLYHAARPWSRMRIHPDQKKTRFIESGGNQEDRIIRQRYIGNEPEWMRRSLHLYAKGLRVGWKIFTGRYW